MLCLACCRLALIGDPVWSWLNYDRLVSLVAGDDISISRPIRLAASARLVQI